MQNQQELQLFAPCNAIVASLFSLAGDSDPSYSIDDGDEQDLIVKGFASFNILLYIVFVIAALSEDALPVANRAWTSALALPIVITYIVWLVDGGADSRRAFIYGSYVSYLGVLGLLVYVFADLLWTGYVNEADIKTEGLLVGVAILVQGLGSLLLIQNFQEYADQQTRIENGEDPYSGVSVSLSTPNRHRFYRSHSLPREMQAVAL